MYKSLCNMHQTWVQMEEGSQWDRGAATQGGQLSTRMQTLKLPFPC